MSVFNALCPTFTPTVSSSTRIPLQCFDTPINAEAQQALINYSKQNQICGESGSFPTIGGKTVNYNVYDYPLQVALDERSVAHAYTFLGDLTDVSTVVSQECNSLLTNNLFPGCSRTTGASGACEWKPVVVGQRVGTNNFESCGGTYSEQIGPFSIDKNMCDIAGSFCQRVAFDKTYQEACCRKRLETDFGLSQTVWIKDIFWRYPNTPIPNVNNPSTFFTTSITSASYNPYQIYCDPQWCANSPTCDTTFFNLCKWSTTTNDDGVIHACLAGKGECYNWYNRSTNYPSGQTALINGVHSWLLIDTMIKDYCLNSTTVVNGTVTTTDTQSCACVGTGNTQVNKPSTIIYFTSCSEIGITCDQNVVPVVPVSSAPDTPFTTAPQVLNDVICSNLACLDARQNRTTSFLTSGIQERALACPEQVCILANLNSTFSAGDIGTGTRYIFDQGQFCFGYSFSENATTYQVVEFPTIWFFSNVQNTVTNPNLTSILRLRNVSTESNNIMTWSVSYNVTLPPFIVQQGTNYGTGVLPGKEASMEWVLGSVTTHPAYFNLPLAITMLDQNNNPTSIQSLTLNFAITDIDKPNAPSPSGNDFNPNDLPLNVREVLSPGGIALIAFAVLMFILFFALVLRAIQTRNLVSRALSKKRFDLL
jgi:hypothetical protein